MLMSFSFSHVLLSFHCVCLYETWSENYFKLTFLNHLKKVSNLSLSGLTLTCLSLRAVLICPWAEKGADALGPDGLIIHSDAFPPKTLVDTLGAGDTFNAAVIYTLSNGETLYHPSMRHYTVHL